MIWVVLVCECLSVLVSRLLVGVVLPFMIWALAVDDVLVDVVMLVIIVRDVGLAVEIVKVGLHEYTLRKFKETNGRDLGHAPAAIPFHLPLRY